MLALELKALEAELHHPGSRCSRDRLERLLHSQFYEVGRSGRPYRRDTVIEYLLTHPGGSGVIAFDYLATQLSDDAALLTYQTYQPGPDESRTLETYRSSVWRRTTLGWQLFYHQGTPA